MPKRYCNQCVIKKFYGSRGDDSSENDSDDDDHCDNCGSPKGSSKGNNDSGKGTGKQGKSDEFRSGKSSGDGKGGKIDDGNKESGYKGHFKGGKADDAKGNVKGARPEDLDLDSDDDDLTAAIYGAPWHHPAAAGPVATPAFPPPGEIPNAMPTPALMVPRTPAGPPPLTPSSKAMPMPPTGLGK